MITTLPCTEAAAPMVYSLCFRLGMQLCAVVLLGARAGLARGLEPTSQPIRAKQTTSGPIRDQRKAELQGLMSSVITAGIQVVTRILRWIVIVYRASNVP